MCFVDRQNKIKEFLPPQYHKTKLLDKEITREYQKLIGMSEVNAKYRCEEYAHAQKDVDDVLIWPRRWHQICAVVPLTQDLRHHMLSCEGET